VELDTPITFEVEITGDGECWWSHNGSILKNDYRITGAESPHLNISHVCREDEGNYQFVVCNEFGQDRSRNAILTVSGKLFE